MVSRWVQGDVDANRGSDSSDRCKSFERESVTARPSCYINQLDDSSVLHPPLYPQHRREDRGAGPSWKFALTPPADSAITTHARNTNTHRALQRQSVRTQGLECRHVFPTSPGLHAHTHTSFVMILLVTTTTSIQQHRRPLIGSSEIQIISPSPVKISRPPRPSPSLIILPKIGLFSSHNQVDGAV